MTGLYELIGEFQKHFREYLETRLDAKTLSTERERSRAFAKVNKLELTAFKQLVLANKSSFVEDFGRKAHNLPTWLDDLVEIRNKVAHYDEIDFEDRREAIRLIRKISGFAKLPTPYLDAEAVKQRASETERKGTVRDNMRISNSDLDRLLGDFPTLSLKRTQDEYRVYREGIGRGSIWIANQRDGYRIVTTGVTNGLKSEIESLTSKKALTMRDRDHLWWKDLTLDQVRGVFKALEKTPCPRLS